MRIIAFETTSDACSVALLSDDKVIQKHEIKAQQQAATILDFTTALFAEADIAPADLTAIAYSCGPGGFTGIRIGAAVAEGIALAHEKPLLAIPSLQVFAVGAHRQFSVTEVKIVLDAKMQQVYYGHYCLDQKGRMQAQVQDGLFYLEELASNETFSETLTIITDLSGFLSNSRNCLRDFYPEAQDVLKLACNRLQYEERIHNQLAQPIYLRSSNAWKKTNSA